MSPNPESHCSSIRSYALRGTRMTAAQRAALAQHWHQVGVLHGELLDLDELFGRTAPRVMEIGFGMGDSLAELAVMHPHCDFIGIEVYPPGIGSLLRKIAAVDIGNLRLLNRDAVATLETQIPSASLDQILILFPDPWPKRRHAKRRLLRTETLALLNERLKPGGHLTIATDWMDYAEQIKTLLEAAPELMPARHDPVVKRVETKYERRARRLGHAIHEFLYEHHCSRPWHA